VAGLKVIFTAQEAPGATLEPHAETSNVYGPVIANGGTGSGPDARLVNVSDWVVEKPTSWSPYASDEPERENPGVPVPVRAAVSELAPED
jgi:hypothetical protein